MDLCTVIGHYPLEVLNRGVNFHKIIKILMQHLKGKILTYLLGYGVVKRGIGSCNRGRQRWRHISGSGSSFR